MAAMDQTSFGFDSSSGNNGPKKNEGQLSDHEADLLGFFLSHRKETQSQFCKRYGINSTMFSLWKNGKIKPGSCVHHVNLIMDSLACFKASIRDGTYEKIVEQMKVDAKDLGKEQDQSTQNSHKPHISPKKRSSREKYQNSLFDQYECTGGWIGQRKRVTMDPSNLSMSDDSDTSSSEDIPSKDNSNTSSSSLQMEESGAKTDEPSFQITPPRRSWQTAESSTPPKKTNNASPVSDISPGNAKKAKYEINGSTKPNVNDFLLKQAPLPWDKQCLFCTEPRNDALCCDQLKCYSKIGYSLFPHGLGLTEVDNRLCIFAYKEFLAGQTVVPGYWGTFLNEEQLANIPQTDRTFIRKVGQKLYIDGKPKNRADLKDMIETGQVGSLLHITTDDSLSNAVLILSANRMPVIKATRFIAVGDEIMLDAEQILVPNKADQALRQLQELKIIKEVSNKNEEEKQELGKEIKGILEVLQSIHHNLQTKEPDFENIAKMLRPATKTTSKSFQIAKKLAGVEL